MPFYDDPAAAGTTTTVIGNQATNADAVATVTDAVDERAFLYVWNGATWDRAKSDGTGVQASAIRPSGSAGQAPSNATTTAYAASLVAKAAAGNCYGLSGYNSLASAQFIQLHDAAALPADTAVPVVILTVAASSNFSVDFGSYGRRFSTGIVICNSTTGPTKTIGAANCWFDVRYV